MPEGAFYGQELVKKRSFFINEYGNHCKVVFNLVDSFCGDSGGLKHGR